MRPSIFIHLRWLSMGSFAFWAEQEGISMGWVLFFVPHHFPFLFKICQWTWQIHGLYMYHRKGIPWETSPEKAILRVYVKCMRCDVENSDTWKHSTWRRQIDFWKLPTGQASETKLLGEMESHLCSGWRRPSWIWHADLGRWALHGQRSNSATILVEVRGT